MMTRALLLLVFVAFAVQCAHCMPARVLLGGGSTGSIPSTMLRAHVTGSAPCTRTPSNFSCIQTDTTSVPTPLPGFALVRVNVSSVNPSDVDIVEKKVVGKLFGTLGADFSGVVVSVGPLCSGLVVGDTVWGCTKGAIAEYATVLCSITGKLSPDVDPSKVGTLPEVSLTSSQALKKAGAPWDQKNLTVVVTSGSGGTGFVALQLAKAYGAKTVVTATSGAANIKFVKAMGADVVTDFKVTDIWSNLANNSVDVVYDNYGAPGTADKAMPSLKPGGVFIFLPGKNGQLSKHPKEGVKQINYGLMMPSKSDLDALLALHQAGKLVPHVEHSYPLRNASAAFAESASGAVVGKVAIVM